jgi:hypothetical protein
MEWAWDWTNDHPGIRGHNGCRHSEEIQDCVQANHPSNHITQIISAVNIRKSFPVSVNVQNKLNSVSIMNQHVYVADIKEPAKSISSSS